MGTATVHGSSSSSRVRAFHHLASSPNLAAYMHPSPHGSVQLAPTWNSTHCPLMPFHCCFSQGQWTMRHQLRKTPRDCGDFYTARAPAPLTIRGSTKGPPALAWTPLCQQKDFFCPEEQANSRGSAAEAASCQESCVHTGACWQRGLHCSLHTQHLRNQVTW